MCNLNDATCATGIFPHVGIGPSSSLAYGPLAASDAIPPLSIWQRLSLHSVPRSLSLSFSPSLRQSQGLLFELSRGISIISFIQTALLYFAYTSILITSPVRQDLVLIVFASPVPSTISNTDSY